MEAIWQIVGLLIFCLPVFYIWLIILAFQGKTAVTPRQSFACLFIWLIQLPIGAVIGFGCMGGGCSGTWMDIRLFAGILLFDVAPFIWLLRKAEHANGD